MENESTIPQPLLDDISQLASALIQHRKNSVLVLDLKVVDNQIPILLHNLIKGLRLEALDVILQTPGGDIDAAFQIAKLLRKTAKQLNIFVPLYAKSAGSLICLVADQIMLTDLSELGPLDTQIREQSDGSFPRYNSALNGFKALEQVQLHTLETLDIAMKLIQGRTGIKINETIRLATEFAGNTSGTLYSQLNPQKIGEYARALEIGEAYGTMMLTRYMGWSQEDAELTVKTMVKKYPSHEFVIDIEELQMLGLPGVEMDEQCAEIMFELRGVLLETEQSLIEFFEAVPEKKAAKGASKAAKEGKETKETKETPKENPQEKPAEQETAPKVKTKRAPKKPKS